MLEKNIFLQLVVVRHAVVSTSFHCIENYQSRQFSKFNFKTFENSFYLKPKLNTVVYMGIYFYSMQRDFAQPGWRHGCSFKNSVVRTGILVGGRRKIDNERR